MMFENIGNKIKTLAKVLVVVGIIASFVSGVVIIASTDDPIGLLVMILGSISFLISSYLIYGIGELIDITSKIEKNTREGVKHSDAENKIATDRLNQIEKLRRQGLITEEEYQATISKSK